jgi:hypothetical protein
MRPRYETALTAKATGAPAQATIAPPSAGPAARARLKATLFSATAAGNSGRGTCSRTEDCQAGP